MPKRSQSVRPAWGMAGFSGYSVFCLLLAACCMPSRRDKSQTRKAEERRSRHTCVPNNRVATSTTRKKLGVAEIRRREKKSCNTARIGIALRRDSPSWRIGARRTRPHSRRNDLVRAGARSPTTRFGTRGIIPPPNANHGCEKKSNEDSAAPPSQLPTHPQKGYRSCEGVNSSSIKGTILTRANVKVQKTVAHCAANRTEFKMC